MLQEQGQGEPRFLEKFRAALEYEQCHDLKLALDIAGNLNCYDYLREVEAQYNALRSGEQEAAPTMEL